MENWIILLISLVIIGILWSLPLWLVINFTCLVFHISFHITLIQSFALCSLMAVIHNLLFKNNNKGGK